MSVNTSKRQGKKKRTKELGQILFVLPKETLLQDTASKITSSAEGTGYETQALDGSEVKSFYESVVGLNSEDASHGALSHLADEQSMHHQTSLCKFIIAQPSSGDSSNVASKASHKRSAGDKSESVPKKKRYGIGKGAECKATLTQPGHPRLALSTTDVDTSQTDVGLAGPVICGQATKIKTEDQKQLHKVPSHIETETKTVGKCLISKHISKMRKDKSTTDGFPSETRASTTAQKMSTEVTSFGKKSQHGASSETLPLTNLARKKSSKKDTLQCLTQNNKVHLINCMLRSSQEGNIAEVQKYLKCGVKVNARDSFGWTALMCAAHAGNKRMVSFLLEHGASVSVCDHTGKTALDIANWMNHHKVGKLLLLHSKSGTHAAQKLTSPTLPKVFYCNVCKTSVSDATEEKHNSSTVHLFNAKVGRPAKGTIYGLPESNKGFQLMVRGGWDKDKGLGPTGHGSKFPVKTVLKRDRHGLGCDLQSKARVTHFGPKDQQAVERRHSHTRQMKPSTRGKKEQLSKARRDREKEKNFRLQFLMH